MGDSWVNIAKQDNATVVFGNCGPVTMRDLSGNGHNATLQGVARPSGSIIQSSFINTVNCSSGTGSSATAIDHADFDVTDPWSIELVIRRGLGIPLGNPHIIVAGTASATNQFRIMQSAANIWAGIKIGGSEVAVDGPTIANGEVVHLIYVYASAAVTIYKNGSVQSSGTPVLPAIADSPSLFIGNTNAGAANFSNAIGPIAIYKSIELTAAQALNHANAALRYDSRASHTGSSRFSNRGLASGFL